MDGSTRHNPPVASTVPRLVLALVAFLGVAGLGLQITGLTLDGIQLDPTGDPPFPGAARDPFSIVMALALGAALVAYAAVEQRQTGELASLSRQLTARALLLMPIAVVVDIALGGAAANGLDLPLPMESTGTVLVALLCGPFAGALTGFVALILWGMVVPQPLVLPTAPAFAVVAVLTGVLAGAAAGSGLFRPRPRRRLRALLAAGLVLLAVLGALAAHAWLLLDGLTPPPLPALDGAQGLLGMMGWVTAFALVAGAVVGLARLLFLRDVTIVAVALVGLLIGTVTALARTPIVAGVFEGTTGFGFDPWVAAVTASDGDPWLSTLRTLLLFEPLDRMLALLGTYCVAVTLIGVTARVRFPQGEWLIADDDDFALRAGTSMRATRW